MKTITTSALFLACLLFCSQIQAQIPDCGTIPLSKEKIKEIERIASTKSISSGGSVTYLPIKLHLIRRDYSGTSNDTYYFPIQNFLYEFGKLNEGFHESGFQFFLCDTIDYQINNELDYLPGAYSYNDSIQIASLNVNNAINVYYVNGSNSGGRSNFPSGNKFFNWMFVLNYVWQQGETLTHEMGHYFNLYHTHEAYLGYELVDGSNCTTHGDLVCDTPADPYVSPSPYNALTCTYNGSYTDTNGDYFNPSMTNIMSYFSGGCRKEFTPGQFSRASAGHQTRLDLISAGGNQYNFSYVSATASIPQNLRVFEVNQQLRVVWNDTASISQKGYIIERSTNPTTGFRCIGAVPGKMYFDNDYQNGVTYYYRVKSVHAKNQYSEVFQYTPMANSFSIPDSYSSGGIKVNNFYFKSPGHLLTVSYTSKDEPFYDNSSSLTDRPLKTNHNYSFEWYDEFSTSDSFRVWIDFNKNGIFESTEILTDGLGTVSADSFSIDSNLPSGYYRARFRVWEKETALLNSPDRTLYGEAIDFYIRIMGNCSGEIEVTDSMFQQYGGKVTTSDVLYGYGFLSEWNYGPEYNGRVQATQSIELNPGFFIYPGYENISFEIVNDCPN